MVMAELSLSGVCVLVSSWAVTQVCRAGILSEVSFLLWLELVSQVLFS